MITAPTQRLLSAFVVVVALVVGSVIVPAHSAQAQSFDELGLYQARQSIVDASNAARRAAGLPDLNRAAQLDVVAQAWADKQAAANSMSHNPSYSQQVPGGWSWVSENVAFGYKVEEVTSAWMNSPGHKKNIMRPGANSIGVGIAVSASGSLYFTQNIATYAQLPAAPVAPKPVVPPKQQVARLAGEDRYDTAIQISKLFEPGVNVIYVASGLGFADALSAAPAAAAQGGPLLLTPPEALPSTVLDEISRLEPALVVVVGGVAAVSENVYNQIVALGIPVRRDAGVDRFETSVEISKQGFPAGSAESIYVATGWNFPDALSGAAAAGQAMSPVLLIPGVGSFAELSESTRGFLQGSSWKVATVLGGNAVVQASFEQELKSVAASVQRFGGSDRYDTSAKLNRGSFSVASEAFIATGNGFADALAGAAIAGSRGAPLYLAPGSCVPGSAREDFDALGVQSVTLLGGQGALGPGLDKLTVC